MIGTIRISQLPTSDPLDGTEVIIINQNGTTKRSTVGDAVGLVTSVQLSDYASVSGIATVAEGLTGNPSISVSALSVSGVSTLGNVQVSSGIVTATSGIVTYYGDGSKLQNIISGVGIQSTGTVIGTGITTLNFTGLGNTFSVNGSTVDINISGNTNISYASTTRTLSSSTGIGTVLPLVSTSSAGLVPETGTPSGKYLKDDATWAEIPSGGAEPAGAAGEIQINDGADPAGLGVVPGFGYDTDTDTLNVPGDVNLDDGIAGSVTTYQSVAPTANRTILFPNVTGIPGVIQAPSPVEAYYSLWGGFTGAVPFVENGALTVSNGMGYDEVTGILSVRGGFTTGTSGGSSFISQLTVPTIFGVTNFAGRFFSNVPGASNVSAGLFSGTWFTTGTSTTNKPTVLIEQPGATSTGWSPAGTGFGVNSASAFVGRLLDLQKNATSRFSVDHSGMVSYTQDAPVVADTTATLAAANIQNGIVTSDTTAAGVDLTLPTGTDMDTAFVGNYVNQTVHWSVINTGTNAATLLAGADHTIVGAAVVATGTSGRFATRRTAANTWVSYRIS